MTTLREDGISDMKVPKQVRGADRLPFFGRHGAYISALRAGDDTALKTAIGRNIFDSDTSAGECSGWLTCVSCAWLCWMARHPGHDDRQDILAGP